MRGCHVLLGRTQLSDSELTVWPFGTAERWTPMASEPQCVKRQQQRKRKFIVH